MSNLLRLPLELRNEIYRYLIPTKRMIEVSSPRFNYKISSTSTIGSITDSDTKENVSGSGDSTLEQGGHAPPGMEMLDNTLARATEFGVPKAGPPKVTRVRDLADFDGYTKAAYEIDWEDVTTSWGTDMKKNSIFQVCRQISDEALDVMYGENAFKHYLHGDGGLDLKKTFTDTNRCRIRMPLLTAEHRAWTGEITPDIAMWASLVPTLKVLRLVVEEPIQKTYYNATPLEQEMESWVLFMRAFLNCFNLLLEGKSLEVDFNGKTETGKVVKECMTDGYREVRCRLSGDLMFRRGRFSYESGYWDDDDRGFGSWDA